MIQKVTEAFQEYYYLRLHKIHRFEPKISIDQKIGSFRLKTADQIDELKKAFQLRYEVFQKELKGSFKKSGWDIDHHDFQCDHLIIVDERTGQIAATCRLHLNPSMPDFYASREFNLDRILRTDGLKIELGRACIKQNYRRALVISLLWRGLSEYINKSQAQLIFGCASIPIKTPREAALLHRYFYEMRKFTPEYLCPPTLAYSMPDFEAWEAHYKRSLTSTEKFEAQSLIPGLFKQYLEMGACLGGEPAWDEEFGCIDFLTILDRENLNRYFWKRRNSEQVSTQP